MKMDSRAGNREGDQLEKWLCKGDTYFKRYLDPSEASHWLDDSLDAYAMALELSPDNTRILGRIAQVQLKLGRYDKAEQTARRMLDICDHRQPLNNKRDVKAGLFHAWSVLAYAHLYRGRWNEALGCIQEAKKAGGFWSSKLWYAASEAYGGLARRKQGGALLKKLFALALSIAFYPLEKERPALGRLCRVLPALLAGNLYAALGRSDVALEHYLALQKRYPGLLPLGTSLAQLYCNRRDLPKARFWLEKTIKRHPSALDTRLQLAGLMEQSGNLEEAAEVYTQLLDVQPDNARLHSVQGHVLNGLERWQDALWHFETALQLEADPKQRAILAQNLGRLYGDHNPDAAIASYHLAQALNPGEPENYIQLGLLYYQKEDYASAERTYRMAVRRDPKNPRLYSNLGYLRWMANDIENARWYYRQAIELDPTYEIPLNNLGVIYLDAVGDLAAAIGCFEQAIQVNEKYALAWYNLGRAHSFQGRRLEAAQCYQKAQLLNDLTQELDSEELSARIHHLFDPAEVSE